MDSMSAFAMGDAARASGSPSMVFDWHKAARLIKERNPKTARAGLAGDWEYTGGSIWEDGKPVPNADTYTYLASTWATPELDLDGDVMDCMKLAHEPPNADEWGSDTYWPDSALKIVGLEPAGE
jgi:hypothetical protein